MCDNYLKQFFCRIGSKSPIVEDIKKLNVKGKAGPETNSKKLGSETRKELLISNYVF